MIELLEELRLDYGRLSAAAQAREGLGNAYFAQSRETSEEVSIALLAALTHWRAAAGFRMLLDEFRDSRRMFLRVADELTTIRQPLGGLMRALSEPDRDVDWWDISWLAEAERTELTGAHVFLLMHPAALRGGSDLRAAAVLRSRVQPLSGWQVGRLGLTVKSYLDIYDTVALGSRPTVFTLSGVLTPVVLTFARAVSGAMEDTYHWTRLRSRVLPVEPEAAGVIAAITRTLGSQGIELITEAISTMPVGGVGPSVLRAIARTEGMNPLE